MIAEQTEQTELERLEHEMHSLVVLRAQRVDQAEEAIRRANKEFDRDALPIGRKISKLRAAQQQADTPTPVRPTPAKLDTGSHDPEWSQDDIDHYYELKRGVNGRK